MFGMENCTRFTGAEGGARLAGATRIKNILAADNTAFIATTLIHEDAYKIRGSLLDGKQRSVYITRKSRVKCVAYDLKILTDLSIATAIEYQDVIDWHKEMEEKEVLVCTSRVMQQILVDEVLSMKDVNVLVLDSCHLISQDDSLKYVMTMYKQCQESKPRILSLTYPLFSQNKNNTSQNSSITSGVPNKIEVTDNKNEEGSVVPVTIDNTEIKSNDIGVYENIDDFDMYEKLEWKIDTLEQELCCEADFAEDIDNVKRLSVNISKPKELIIEYNSECDIAALPQDYTELDDFMRNTTNDVLYFLNDHRYDPSEIYGDELLEELKNIPDPTLEPKLLLKQFLYMLDQLGPYAADKAAFSILTKLEKLKIKVPYERHFLILCLCTSIFVKMRCMANAVFEKFENDWEVIRRFSTPKLMRFIEILEQFKPPNDKNELKNTFDNKITDVKVINTNKIINELDKCDFIALSNKIEDTVNSFTSNLAEIHLNNKQEEISSENKKIDGKIVTKNEEKGINLLKPSAVGLCKRSGHRMRGRGRISRNNNARILQMQANPDALCGIVYLKEPLMAKILFMIVVELSRNHPSLSFLSVQYCAIEKIADPVKELREFEYQRKKQEEVLKKLLEGAWTVLEDGWCQIKNYLAVVIDQYKVTNINPNLAPTVFKFYDDNLFYYILLFSAQFLKFRLHECNLLLATSSLEEGIDLPRCNLVLRWDVPPSYRSYGLCRGRARAPRSSCVLLSSDKDTNTNEILHNVATYKELDQIISRKCGCGMQNEPAVSEEIHADVVTYLVKPYSPSDIECDIAIKDHIRCLKCNLLNPCPCKVGVRLSNDSGVAAVDLGSAITLINRYCSKLPSDTFTRLTPQWWMEEVDLPLRSNPEQTKKAFVCTLRLPLNCPVKYNIVGHPMPTRVLARRVVALQACRILHKSGELDNQLMPIGKENFKAPETSHAPIATETQANALDANDLARPGTTKRRQYYYKRTAWAFTDCQPIIDTSDAYLDTSSNAQPTSKNMTDGEAIAPPNGKRNILYAIVCKLWCALPERYNTRGRRLHAPQQAKQALGILIARNDVENLQIPSFPVYTRSGEVRVSVEPILDADVRMSPRRGRLVRRFMRFVFAEVLRVRRRGMKLQSEGSTHNNYYIVPTIKTTREDGTTKIDIDWPFLELIYQHTEEKKMSDIEKPTLWHQDEEEEDDLKMERNTTDNTDSTIDNKQESIDIIKKEIICAVENEATCKEAKEDENVVKKIVNPLLKPGEKFAFDPEMYQEAVVTPWYRNQDQPQFFLVAEICANLSPESAFPSATHDTFRHYYTEKYGVEITQGDQPLLDVDHTSARLNLLTPRYVNRKGVALPVSSERTRRAKRDRLDQKQILIPELCRVHPFAAPLWFATVTLPCVLYRINALLIADEIRRCVAIDIGLGIPKINEKTCPGFEWPPLDFGWSLSEVLSADSEKIERKRLESKEDVKEEVLEEPKEIIEEEEETLSTDKEKTLNEFLQEKEDAESGFEIGTWSNEMASSIPSSEYNEYMEPLPPNLTFCTSASGGTNWCDPVKKPKPIFNHRRTFSVADSDCSYLSSDFDTDDSDFLDNSDDEGDVNGFFSSRNSNAAMGVRIEYKTPHEAEAVDVKTEKKVVVGPQPDPIDDVQDKLVQENYLKNGQAPDQYIKNFRQSVEKHKADILEKKLLIRKNETIQQILPETRTGKGSSELNENDKTRYILDEIFPYDTDIKILEDGQVDLETIEENKRKLFDKLKGTMDNEKIATMSCFSMIDVNIDSPFYINEKIVNIGFDLKENYIEKLNSIQKEPVKVKFQQEIKIPNTKKDFDFDFQPELEGHPGPSPSVILQALTMSNANDGINLERLETIGDSFLKFAITAYLYCAHPTVHEGKLSHMRSKQVSNLSLYRLGRNKRLGARMIASKFEPLDNWLPPCHKPPSTMGSKTDSKTDKALYCPIHGPFKSTYRHERCICFLDGIANGAECFIPYNLITQHSIPDKSIADCVEALIGAYLIECGPRGALLFMLWLGIQVLPRHDVPLSENHPYAIAEESRKNVDLCSEKKPSPPLEHFEDISESESDWSEDESPSIEKITDEDNIENENWSWAGRAVGSLKPYMTDNGVWMQPVFGELKAPPSPLLRYIDDPDGELEQMLSGYDALERTLQYKFKDRSLLLQALTHASHQQNRLTDCYQRLEFLGDAILDYLITRYLYEDERRHSPGALTDLRSALVNNTIFATLAVRHGFHKYFRHMSPGLNEVLTKYVKIQEENGHSISEEHYLIQEDEMEQAEDVEVPKALGDLFESVAGAIFLDSDMSLGAVWKSYVNLMGAELEAFSAAAPKSPVRELLEAEPDTAKFGKPERLADGRRVRVCVEVFGRGTFKGIGRNYRIAKGTAARCALRHLKKAHRV